MMGSIEPTKSTHFDNEWIETGAFADVFPLFSIENDVILTNRTSNGPGYSKVYKVERFASMQ